MLFRECENSTFHVFSLFFKNKSKKNYWLIKTESIFLSVSWIFFLFIWKLSLVSFKKTNIVQFKYIFILVVAVDWISNFRCIILMNVWRKARILYYWEIKWQSFGSSAEVKYNLLYNRNLKDNRPIELLKKDNCLMFLNWKIIYAL